MSPVEADKDPELMPELKDLPDEEFEKAALKYYAERDVFAFSSILSLNYKGNQNKLPFLGTIHDYLMTKAEKHCSAGKFQEFKQLLASKNVGLLLAERMINVPVEVVPSMHTELPADLEFTKVQEEITDPKEFNYSHLLVLSKFTIPQGSGEKAGKDMQDLPDKAFYKWEDQVLWPESDVSFTYMSTFRYVDDDGKKQTYQGSQGGKEIQYRLVYLIPFKKYLAKIKTLNGMATSISSLK